MSWFHNLFRKPPSHPAQAWHNSWEQRRLERQARVADAEARLQIARAENNSTRDENGRQKFGAIVATFDGIKEIECEPRVVHSGNNCPKCGHHGVQRLWGKERRCAQCGEQWLSG
jgi:ribosomal protein L37AE/L43A